MAQINFKGTFCIPYSRMYARSREKIYQKKDRYRMTIEGIEFRDKINETYITVPDEMDTKVSKLLDKHLICYYYFNAMERLNIQDIYNRLKIDDSDRAYGYELHEINVNEFDKLLRLQPKYVGYKASGDGSYEKYCRFMRFLHTKHDIMPPRISISKKQDGTPAICIDDGRHRFAVLRDIGMEKIPVMIDKKSVETGKEIGIL